MSISSATKHRWFDRGAAAFERTFPGRIAAHFGAGVGPVYVCPICDRGFLRQAVDEGILTAEHVPPLSFGGRELLLTCKNCNNEAGSRFDAHAHRKETISDVMKGTAVVSRKVRVGIPGHQLNARLEVSRQSWTLRVPNEANNPAAVAAFQNVGPLTRGTDIVVNFAGDRFADLGARLSWFRSGFLALFAFAGYQFSCDPALEIAKKQLREHETRLIYSFTIDIPKTFAWSDWKILEIPEPRCTGVVFGAYVVLFPHKGDMTFYQRLETQIRSSVGKTAADVTAQGFELKKLEPTFGYEIEGEGP